MTDANKRTIVIVDDSPVVRADIESVLLDSGRFRILGMATNGRDAVNLCDDVKPDLVLIDVHMPIMNGIDASRRIMTTNPGTIIIMLSSLDDLDVVRASLSTGARDFIRKPVQGSTLVDNILKIYARERGRGHTRPGQAGPPGASAATAESTDASDRMENVWTFFGPKAGTGATTLATNAAVVVARGLKRRVLAVDLDFFFGDLTYGLGCRSESSLIQALTEADTRDAESVRKFVVSTESGVHLLSAPTTPKPGALNKKKVLDVLQSVQDRYDTIIVDLPASLDVLRDRVMEETGRLVMPISNDFQSVRAAGIYLEALKNSNFPMSRVHVVFNRVSGSDGVTTDEFKRLVKFPIFAELPHDRRTVNEAYLACIPYASQGRSHLFHETELLVSKLVSSRPS